MKLPSKSILSTSDIYEKYNFTENDVKYVMEYCDVEFDVAMNALVEKRGDIIGSVDYLIGIWNDLD